MPKLTLFAACERVIIDQQNILSLIAVLQELKIQVPVGGPSPQPSTTGSIKWDIITMWEGLRSDEGNQYEQRLALFDPAGQPTPYWTRSIIEAKVGQMIRTVATIFGFPIGSPGRYTLKLWLSENGRETEQPVAEYSINVTHEILKK